MWYSYYNNVRREMKLVIQRVSRASCKVDNEITGMIDNGYMILVGLGQMDNKDIVFKMAEKVSKLRIFEDEQGKTNKSIYDVNGKILSISQFTLFADCSKGNRPSFTDALNGDKAKELYDYFNKCLEDKNLEVYTGKFGADMKVELLNDGPFTIVLNSEEL